MGEEKEQKLQYLGLKRNVDKCQGFSGVAVAVAEEGPGGKEAFPEHLEQEL